MSTWSKPTEGVVKVNVKGVCDGYMKGAISRVMRDSNGEWIKGCKSMIGFSLPIIAELWGIFYGMKLAWEKEESYVILESESVEAMNHVLNPDPNFCLFELVTMIRHLKSEAWEQCDLVVVVPSANLPTAALADNVMSDEGGLIDLSNAPSSISSLLAVDKRA